MKEFTQLAIVTTVACLMVVFLAIFPEIRLDVFRWSSIAAIPIVVVLLFGGLRWAVGRQVARRAYFGLLPLAFYLGLAVSLTGLLLDHYGQSRTTSLGNQIKAYPLEALFTFSLGASLAFVGLSLLGLLGVGLARGLCNLVRPQLTDGGDDNGVN